MTTEFDMRKAREICARLSEPGEFLSEDWRVLGAFLDEMQTMFPAALDRIEELVAECERLQENNRHLQTTIDEAHGIMNETGIQLAFHVNELARWQKIAQEAKAEASYNDDCITDEIPLWKEAKEKIKEDYREQAAQELGIATGDHVRDTTKLILTAEQRAALDAAIERLGWSFDWEEDGGVDADLDSQAVLRSMLDQSVPAWEITDKRRAVIGRAIRSLEDPNLHHSDTEKECVAVLRAMLEEARP